MSPNDAPTPVLPAGTVIKWLVRALGVVAFAFAGFITYIAQDVRQDVKDNGEKIDLALIATAGNQNDIKFILRYLDLVKLDVDREMRTAIIFGHPTKSTDVSSGKEYVRAAGVYDAKTETMDLFRLVIGAKDRDEHIERAVTELHFLTNRLISFNDIENGIASESGDIPKLDGKQFDKFHSYLIPGLRCSESVPGCGINVSEVHAAFLRLGWKKGATVSVDGSDTYRALVTEISNNPDFLEPAELM